MKSKPLPDQALLLVCLHYDPLTGELTWLHRPEWTFEARAGRTPSHMANAWNAAWAGKRAFTSTAVNGYKTGSINNQSYYAHRVIYKMITGTEPKDIDHEDGVRSRNVFKNLIDKGQPGNAKNRCLSSNNTSGYHGVSYSKRHNLWLATIYDDGKPVYLGWYKVKDDAIKARKEAESRYSYHVNHGREPI